MKRTPRKRESIMRAWPSSLKGIFTIVLFSVCTSMLHAQEQTTIKGKVTDENGESLAGVSVQVEGTGVGTTTNEKGEYQISAAAGAKLVFSFITYKRQVLPVAGRTAVDVQLEPDRAATDLDEVVVVGYGTQKRTDVTGSVASVPKERLAQLPVTNVLQAVQGAVSGVNINQPSSVPGAQPTTVVRGQNSINANSGPFIVVDGIPLSKTGGSLNDINPNDIESMEILKDASAVAIYGTNGANGVMLITTKRGATGEPVIRYNGYAGVEDFSHVLKPRSGEEYAQKYQDWLTQTGNENALPLPNYGEMPNYEAGITRDWIETVSQTGVIQDHNVNISGGTENVKYFVSGGLLDQKGIIQGYQYKRISFRSNLDITLTDYLKIGTSLFIANNNYDGGRANLLFAEAMSPYAELYNEDGTYKIFAMEPEQLYTNPMLGLVTDRIQRNTNLNGNAYAEVDFSGLLPGLKYRMNLGYSYLPAREASYVGRAANNLNGFASVFNSETNSYVLENILTYNKDIDKHHIDVTALYSAQQRSYTEALATATGFANDDLSFHKLSAGKTQTSDSNTDQYRLNSQMLRINYNYDSRYLFTATGRRDGSSVFGRNTSKYGFFPSVALGWNVSNEEFLTGTSWLDNLKIRTSYGVSGNEAIGVYSTITRSNVGRSPFNGVSTIAIFPDQLGNDDLKWETTTSANLGIDFALFGSRISGTVDMYQSKTKDLLMLRRIPEINGYADTWQNLGRTSNRGIEVTLNSTNIKKENFTWETTVVYNSNRNRITELYGDGQDDIGNKWFIGQPIGTIFDYNMLGVWQVGEDPSIQDPNSQEGDLKFADLNGDGSITPEADRMILGQTQPKWTGGLTNTFRYKNFNLRVFIQTVQGVLRNNPELSFADESGRRNTPAEVGYWTEENQSNTRPSLRFTNPRGYGYPSDGSFTRLKDVTLSYAFNQDVLERLHLGGLTIFASGRNLGTITNWIGWDPEAVQEPRGVGNFDTNYPLVKSFILGVNVSLR